MPYSEGAHSKFVSSILAAASLIRMNSAVYFFMFYPEMSLPRVDLYGKTAIVTGANSGIGYECANTLASMGAHVILACRNLTKGQEAARKIRTETGNDKVQVEVLDCASFESVKAFVERWNERESKAIDILINNAGAFTHSLQLTPDGYEQTYQTNHLSHVMLTLSLLNRGYLSSNARIVSVSSNMYYESDAIDPSTADNSDIIAKHGGKFGTFISFSDMTQMYHRSKASQAIWSMVLQRELAKNERWKDITVHSCHPGCVKSSIWSQPEGAGAAVGLLEKALFTLGATTGISSEQGAVVPVWLATAAEPASPELRGMFWDRMKWKWGRANITNSVMVVGD
ncbi:short chain dehydrogenase [Ceratobasidium sp. AG-Ba]|nr:short chain dehydrogenase [Ceratobasidium sp. AG-Ba]